MTGIVFEQNNRIRKTGKPGSNKKRIYLFIMDENNNVVNKREQQLLLLKPDFVANGQAMHCAKENILFWRDKYPGTGNVLGSLPIRLFFGHPKLLDEAKNAFTRDLTGNIIATKTT